MTDEQQKENCAVCGGSGWKPNVGPDGKRRWSFLMNDALPCECGALARNYAAEKERTKQNDRR